MIFDLDLQKRKTQVKIRSIIGDYQYTEHPQSIGINCFSLVFCLVSAVSVENFSLATGQMQSESEKRFQVFQGETGPFDVANKNYLLSHVIISSSKSLDPDFPARYAKIIFGISYFGVVDSDIYLHTGGPSSAIATNDLEVGDPNKLVVIAPNDRESDLLQRFWLDDKFKKTKIPGQSILVEPEEENPRHGKNVGSIYLEMRLLGDTEDNMLLVSVSDQKEVVIDKVCPYSQDYTLLMSEFKPDESLVGVIIYPEVDCVIACSDQRKCVVQTYALGQQTARVFETGEGIDQIFLAHSSIFLMVFNRRSNSVSFYEIGELRYRDKQHAVSEVHPFNTQEVTKCSANYQPVPSQVKCFCQMGLYTDYETNTCKKCHTSCAEQGKYECSGPDESNCSFCYLPEGNYDEINQGCKSQIMGTYFDKEVLKRLPCPDLKCSYCDQNNPQKCYICFAQFPMDSLGTCLDCADPNVYEEGMEDQRKLCSTAVKVIGVTVNGDNRFVETSKQVVLTFEEKLFQRDVGSSSIDRNLSLQVERIPASGGIQQTTKKDIPWVGSYRFSKVDENNREYLAGIVIDLGEFEQIDFRNDQWLYINLDILPISVLDI